MKPEVTTREELRKNAMRSMIIRVIIFTLIILAAFIVVCAINYFLETTNSILTEEGWVTYTYRMPFDTSLIVVLFLFLWLVGTLLIIWQKWSKTQRAVENIIDGADRDNLRRAIQARYRNRFWVSFALYSAIMVLLIAAFFVLKDSRIWYDYDPWYTTLVILRNIFPFAVIALWAGGAAVLLFRQWNRSASDIVELVGSIEQMHQGTLGDRIDVPNNLAELQPVLQEMFDTSNKDRQAVLETEKKKNDMILYLAHDLKTPLTSVVGYLSLLSESTDLDAQHKNEYITIAKDKALRLEGLIDQFFEISRFSFQETEITRAPFSLNLLLLQITDEFYPLLKDREKQIAVTCEDDIQIMGDANLLARALNNVIRNAISYSAPESTIEIEATQRESAVEISIANEGKDIPQPQLDMIFEKFHRLDEARTTESGGSGLGLAIAQEIIVHHQGTITAASSNGRITFAITLPR